MIKLLKFFKGFRKFVPFIVLLIVIQAVCQLLLPDYMSKIIGEGIHTYEKVDGEVVYIQGSETPVMKFEYVEQPGRLILNENGEAVVVGVYDAEIEMMGQKRPVPMFLREGGGAFGNQGVLYVDENGLASVMPVGEISTIMKYGLIMLGITLIITLTALSANWFASKAAMGFGANVRGAVYKKVSRLSQEDTGRIGTASLITRTTNDITQIQQVTFMAFRFGVMAPVMLAGGLIMALVKSAKMSVVLAVAVPVIAIVIAVTAVVVIPLFRKIQKSVDNLTLVSRENLTGVRIIRAFGREGTEDKRFEEANRGITGLSLKANKIMVILMPVMTVVMSLTSLAVIAMAMFIVKGSLLNSTFTDLSNMMAVTQYLMQIMMAIMFATMLFIMLPRALASAARVNEVLDSKETVFDPENPKSPDGGFKGNLKFNNVSFIFAGAEIPAIKELSFECKPGTVTAVIGGTGSGKSTLINLIPRLFDVSEGSITLDGVDIREMKQQELREQIGFIPQKAFLFAGTIRDNLKAGNENAEDERLLKAADIAQCGFIAEYEDGLGHAVEQGGANFSGGQKQRLSIARALAKDAKIFIFDDCFSALDFKTEANLRAAIKSGLADATVIIVAQRIGTVKNADSIIVLDEGKAVGCGKHEELMENCSVYKEIALSQLSAEELQ